MESEQREFIKKLLQAGNTREEVRRALISDGRPTAGYDTQYADLLRELGVEEPKQKMPNMQAMGEAPLRDKNKNLPPRTPIVQSFYALKILFLIGMVCAAILYGGKFAISFLHLDGSAEEENGQDLNDIVLQSKVRTTVASARIQGGRMGSYDGVCKDISVVAPLQCLQTPVSFVIFAPLSDGTYFCEDKAESPIVLTKEPISGEKCQ